LLIAVRIPCEQSTSHAPLKSKFSSPSRGTPDSSWCASTCHKKGVFPAQQGPIAATALPVRPAIAPSAA
jgi:hypothetical protein